MWAYVRTCGLGSRYPSHMKQRSRKREEEFRSELPACDVRGEGRREAPRDSSLVKEGEAVGKREKGKIGGGG